MKAIDAFLQKHEVDVGRSLGLLLFLGAIDALYEMAGQLFFGRLNIDFSFPLGIVFGLAAWRHASWLRTVMLVAGWLAVGVGGIFLIAAPFIGTANLTLALGSTRISNPSLWQLYAAAVLGAPVAWFVLSVLHSDKAKAEFHKPR